MRMLKEKKNTSVFAKKLNSFLSHHWEAGIEKQLVKTLYKYKTRMEEEEEQGKQYLQKMYDANENLIENSASEDFKTEFQNLISEYKTNDESQHKDLDLDIEDDDGEDQDTEDSKNSKVVKHMKNDPKLVDIDTDEDKSSVKKSEELYELQDQTKCFNKKTRKPYSDQPYISENKNLMITRQNLDNFFSIIDNEEAQSLWWQHIKSLQEGIDITDDLTVANGIINLYNLEGRAEQYFSLLGESLTVKENYLYRPTGEYKYKVKLHMNPYADKESCIYFDNKDTAEEYASNSKGKYEYIGTESLSESFNKNTVELLIEKLKSFDWYGNLNSISLKEAKEYIKEEKEIQQLVEKCGKLGLQIYNKYCPWKKVQRLKEEFGGTSGITLNKDSVGYNTNPMNTAIQESIASFDFGDEEHEESTKPLQLYYMYDSGGPESGPSLEKDWMGGFDTLEELKDYAFKNWIESENEEGRYENSKSKLKPNLNSYGLPMGYIYEENKNNLNEYGSRASKIAKTGKGKIFDNEDKLEEVTDSLEDTDYDTGMFVEADNKKSSNFSTKGIFKKVVQDTMPYNFSIGSFEFKLFLSGQTKKFILKNLSEGEIDYQTESFPKMIDHIEGLIDAYDSIDLKESFELWGEDDENSIQDEVEVGDYVDFGGYGRLYVCSIGLDTWRVTDREHDRTNPDALGWNIKPYQAKSIIENYNDLNESLSEDYEQLERIQETDQIADDILFDSDDSLMEDEYPWNDCIKDQKKRYGSKETAKKVCGSIKAKNESIQIKSILKGLYESITSKKKLNEDLDTDEISYKITPKYKDMKFNDVANKVVNLLTRKYEIPQDQIIKSNNSVIIRRLPLDLYVNVDKDIKKLSNQVNTKMIGHYSDNIKYFDAEKGDYSSEPEKKPVGKYTTVIESKKRSK